MMSASTTQDGTLVRWIDRLLRGCHTSISLSFRGRKASQIPNIPTRQVTYAIFHAVYNVVSLDDASVVEEMISHFKRFWSTPDAVEKSRCRIQHAVDERASNVMEALQRDPAAPAVSERIAEFEAAMIDVQKSTDDLASKLTTLTPEDFLFGFHAMPHTNIGHLHMHVATAPAEFRKHSTDSNDWKTIPATAVMEVIRAEKTPKTLRSSR